MAKYLKQSTAAAIMFGPFVDKTDGVTLEVGAGIITSIDHATTGIFLSKNGAAGAIRNQAVTASTLDAYGMFRVTLDTTDTGTVGNLRVMMAEAATFLPVHDDYVVLPANVYDSLMGTDLLDVNQAQVLGTAVHASSEAGTQCVEVVRWGGNDIAATAVNGVPKVALTHVNAAAQTATLDTIKAETVLILADTGTTLENRLIAIEADTDVIDDATSGLVKIASDVAAVLVDTSTTLENRLIAIEADTDVIDDVTSGLVKIASDAAAVKVQTDKLVFTVANQVDANVQYVNDVALTGDGDATPWGPV